MENLIPANRIMKHGPRRLKGRKHRWDREKKTFVEIPRRRVIDSADVKKAQEMFALPKKPVVESGKFDMANYRPLPGRVLIHIGEEVVEENGVLIPDASRERPKHRRVVLIGPGETDFKIGDLVLMDRNAHQKPVVLDGKSEHVLVWAYDVAAVVKS